jgi:FKBP-type peptidyl-prolyl cis-trans isomerase 2
VKLSDKEAKTVTDTKLTVTDDLVVSLDYTLRLRDGEVLAETAADDGDALEFVQGQGQIMPALEQALYGMQVGEEKDVIVQPADAFGERDPAASTMVERHMFPQDMALTPGTRLSLQDSSGQSFEASVAEVHPDAVLLDFNHPLAGETLYFRIKIAGLRQPTGDDLVGE